MPASSCLLAFLALCGVPVRAFDVALRGHVVDENAAPVPGAQVTVRPGPWQTQSDPTGAFTITLPAAGNYFIQVTREGYYELKDQAVSAGSSQEITLVVNSVREVLQSIDVTDRPSPLDIAQAQRGTILTGTVVNDIPYPASHNLRNSMKLIPGVVQDSTGALHFNGSSEDQVCYLLNGFDIADPITGMLRTRLGMEGVRSIEYWSGLYSPEFGKGSAGALAIRTANGTDQFHYTATNFIPGVDLRQGIRLGDWYPRFGISGPVLRGRAWFADNFSSEYNQTLVTGLPKGSNTRDGWTGSNLLHTQFNVTPSSILTSDFLVNLDDQRRVGLGPLDPVSTTSNLRSRQWFASVKGQFYLGHGSLIEIGYARNYVSDAQASQGQDLYILSTLGRGGNHYINSHQEATRDQATVASYLPAFHAAGIHQIKVGVDASRLSYTGDFRRTGYEIVGLSGQLISRTLFGEPASFHMPDTETAVYLLDVWRINKRLQIDLGARRDWDRQLADHAWSPRVSFS
ncbi:MAG: TonB-dependent receptor, partial [Acidobacteria bacterium]|nr:TonB-dependent receptor [Acidobacteriota bacterium]